MKKVLILVLSLVFIFSLVACGGETVNLNDYLSVEFSGTNGDGNAMVVGFDEFEEDLMQKGDDVGLSELFVVESGVDYQLDKKSDLTNGDKVTLTITVDEDIAKKYGVNIKGGTEIFTVEGLPEKVYEEVDPFADIVCEFEGVSPFITCRLKYTNDFDVYDDRYTVTCERETDKYLQNGDVLTLKFTYDTEQAEKDCIKYIPTEKTMTLDGYDTCIQSWDELPNETINEIKTKAKEKVSAALESGVYLNTNRHDPFAETKIEYVGNYFLNPKADPISDFWYGGKVYNYSILVFKANVKMKEWNGEEFDKDVYCAVYVNNMMLKSDGTFTYNTEELSYDGVYYTVDELYNDKIADNKVNYNCIENIE